MMVVIVSLVPNQLSYRLLLAQTTPTGALNHIGSRNRY